MSTKTISTRDQVAVENTWRLEDIFESDQDVQAAIASSKQSLGIFKSYQNQVTSNANTLFEVLKKSDDVSMIVEKIYVYCHMRLHQDGGNSFYQDLASQSEKLMVDLETATSFISPEISTLTEAQLEAFLQENPELTLYKRVLHEVLRQKEHILDAKTEDLLSQFGEITTAPSNTFAMFNNADLKLPTIQNEDGEDVRITHGNYISLLESHNRSVRESAFTGMYTSYSNFKNTLATNFAASVTGYSLVSRIRNFRTPIACALNANNIPTEVYDNLITTVDHHLNLMHDYVALRKDIMGVDTLHMYDIFVPLVNDFKKEISFDEACSIILEALKPLGEDYVAQVKEAFDSRWVDKYENEGKRSGAYSWGCFAAPHPYVLMNYSNNVDNLFTLAHEMGHAMHSYLSSHTQPYPYANYCIFVAEVASTVNEALLMQYLLKTTTDPDFHKYLVNYFMEQFRGTLFRQTMFAEFEKSVYTLHSEGATLTSQVLCDTYYNLVKKYHGDAICVDDLIAMEWARIPHFYTPFYVYQYATGYSAAIALSEGILKEGPEAVKRYKAFLSGGSSQDPIDLLKMAGVDMSSPAPIESALKVFEGLIAEMKTL
ncbi:oligoendopeptidase F [Niameybacter massiliensis]|uniref:Oligopeptidase F n=1 Tax=Holtiella tumoricola TaxID=3018743 RepID=A0AA42DKC7_9FIRM|nr:oligoendopeptidase F [Holtiella tumoricola]MDA3730626.1 oligoendopeptidase F [Holtiella tumoricola]